MLAKFFKYAFIGGFTIGIAVGLSMDLMLGQSLGGSWKQAVSADIERYFGAQYATNNLYVYAGIVVSILIIGILGGFVTGLLTMPLAMLYCFLMQKK